MIVAKEIKRITLLGTSAKFIDLAKDLFPEAELTLIPWRLNVQASHQTEKQPDLLIVCGYDYGSSLYAYDKYYAANVTHPLAIAKRVAGKDTQVIYIDTLHGTERFTFSRYQFAKNALAVKLGVYFHHLIVLGVPSIVSDAGVVDVHGGILTKFIFNTLIRLGVVQTIASGSLKTMLLDALYKQHNQLKLVTLSPKYLSIRRTLFADRLLRFVNG